MHSFGGFCTSSARSPEEIKSDKCKSHTHPTTWSSRRYAWLCLSKERKRERQLNGRGNLYHRCHRRHRVELLEREWGLEEFCYRAVKQTRNKIPMASYYFADSYCRSDYGIRSASRALREKINVLNTRLWDISSAMVCALVVWFSERDHGFCATTGGGKGSTDWVIITYVTLFQWKVFWIPFASPFSCSTTILSKLYSCKVRTGLRITSKKWFKVLNDRKRNCKIL